MSARPALAPARHVLIGCGRLGRKARHRTVQPAAGAPIEVEPTRSQKRAEVVVTEGGCGGNGERLGVVSEIVQAQSSATMATIQIASETATRCAPSVVARPAMESLHISESLPATILNNRTSDGSIAKSERAEVRIASERCAIMGR